MAMLLEDRACMSDESESNSFRETEALYLQRPRHDSRDHDMTGAAPHLVRALQTLT